MSKIIYVCFKNPTNIDSNLEKKLETIIKRITPDNIIPRPPKIVASGNVIYGIYNPSTSIKEKGGSVLLGIGFGEHEQWCEPGQPSPEGSFSIFRSNHEKTEILTDEVGSRTIWYFQDDDIFIASSSQRAIVMFLGSFKFNEMVIPWMISTGSLGPYYSWDSRIKLLPSNSSAMLDFKSWNLTLKENVVKFSSSGVSYKEHDNSIRRALSNTFRNLNIDFSKWVLPLSGGYDSRAILCFFRSIGLRLANLKAITWGLESGLKEPGNDAFVAKKLATHFKISHKYYLTDISTEPIKDVFDRFLICGEGRIDHIGGYMDGFKIWKDLYEDQIEGIIRGDEGFGRLPVISEADVRKHVEIALCSDYPNLVYFNELGLSKQHLPENLQRQKDETLETWRDRLYHQFRMPVVHAALTDLKLSFVEVINPFLSRQILREARSLPDHLRTDKKLFKDIVNSISPNIDYATSSAIGEASYILKYKSAVDLFKLELSSGDCKSVLPERFLNYLLQNLVIVESKVNKMQILKSFLKRYLPKFIVNKGSKLMLSNNLSVNRLAFRSYIICKMNRMLIADAKL